MCHNVYMCKSTYEFHIIVVQQLLRHERRHVDNDPCMARAVQHHTQWTIITKHSSQWILTLVRICWPNMAGDWKVYWKQSKTHSSDRIHILDSEHCVFVWLLFFPLLVNDFSTKNNTPIISWWNFKDDF